MASTLTERMEEYLSQLPNKMATDISILGVMYPTAKQGDMANGGRMGCIRRIARNNPKFIIIGEGARTIALVAR